MNRAHRRRSRTSARPHQCGGALRAAASACLLLIAVVGGLSACETGVEPIVQGDRYFSLYGFLDMRHDTQYVRVEAVAPTLRVTSPEALEARVTSTDLATGDSTVWRDSVVTFSDGTYGHVFWTPLRIIASHTYRIEVERPDGRRTWAETTVPARPEPEVQPAVSFNDRGVMRARQQIIWHDVPRAPFTTNVKYRFFGGFDQGFTDLEEPPELTRLEDDTWTVHLNLTRAADSLLEKLGSPRVMGGVSMAITLQDAAWTFPDGVFDPDVLSNPGVFSNVTNGFGFLGAVGSYSTEWVLTPRVIDAMGFLPPDQQKREGQAVAHAGLQGGS